MRALVTGVSGFVGGYLAEYLLSLNIEVWGTAHKSLVYLEESPDFMKRICIRTIDISNKHQVKKVLMECKPDFIFHLASQSSVATSWENPQLTIDINVNGTINLLESIKELKQNARILLVGSCEEYGFVEPDSVPINENQELKPTTPYAVSKATQSMLGTLYNKSYGIDIVVVRAFNQIGIRQDARFVVPSLAKKIARIEKKESVVH